MEAFYFQKGWKSLNCRTSSKTAITIILLYWAARKFSLFFPGLENNCMPPQEEQIWQPKQKWQYYANSLLFPLQHNSTAVWNYLL